MNDVIEWFKRSVTISGITACMCMYPRVYSIFLTFSMVPQSSAKKLQLNFVVLPGKGDFGAVRHQTGSAL